MSASVKVSNKTNGAKGILAQFRLVDVDLECCGEMVPSGSSITVPTEDWLLNKGHYARLVKLGALTVEDVVDAPVTEEKPVGPALVSLAESVPVTSDVSVTPLDEKPWTSKKVKKVDQEGG